MTGYLVCAGVVSQQGIGARQRTAARIFGGRERKNQGTGRAWQKQNVDHFGRVVQGRRSRTTFTSSVCEREEPHLPQQQDGHKRQQPVRNWSPCCDGAHSSAQTCGTRSLVSASRTVAGTAHLLSEPKP